MSISPIPTPTPSPVASPVTVPSARSEGCPPTSLTARLLRLQQPLSSHCHECLQEVRLFSRASASSDIHNKVTEVLFCCRCPPQFDAIPKIIDGMEMDIIYAVITQYAYDHTREFLHTSTLPGFFERVQN